MKLVSKKAKCAFIALLLALGLMPMMAYAAPTGEDDSLDISNAEVVWKSEVVATDSNLCPIVSVTLNGTTLDEGQDYLIEYYRKGMYGDFSIKLPGASALPGTYQVRLLGAGPGSGYYGYYGPIIYDVVAGSSQDPIEITSIDVIDKVVGYDGTEKKPSVVVKAGDSVVSNDQLNVVYENNVNAGTATVTVTAKEDGMYFGSLSAQFTILPSEITDVTLETEEVTYNANEQKPAVKEVKAGNIVVPESAFDVAYSNNKNCGNATVTITAKENGNFTGSVEKSFTISPARITLIVLDENVFVYDGTWHEPSFKVYAGAIEVPALAYTKAYTNNLNATASASVKVSMNDGQNFTGELTKYFTILPAPLKSMTLSPTSYNYDGKQKSPTVTVKNASGKTLVDGTDYNLSTPDDRTNAGSYKYTATGKGNYTGSVSATMTIVKNGWVKEDGKWYYYDNGTAVTNKWQKDSKGWVYLGTDGAMVTNKWVKDSKGWCYVGEDGYAVTNKWQKDSKGWCYLGADARMVTNDWVADSKGMCYMDSDGYAVSSTWKKIDGTWYYFDADTHMVTNKWIKDSKGWCYMDADGYAIANQWKQIGGKWYYFDGNARMVTGTQVINGKTYKFDSNGVWIS